MLVVICSDKGSPGVTTTALALAACWPRSPRLLVEADPSGGDLAIVLTRDRQYLPATVSVATVAAAARDAGVEALTSAVNFGDDYSVIPGFLSAESGHGMTSLWDGLFGLLTSTDQDVLVDIGRTSDASPTARLLPTADVVVVVARQSESSLIHLRERIVALRSAAPRAAIVPVMVSAERDGRVDRDTVDDLFAGAGLDVEPADHVAWDSTGLASLRAGRDPRSRSMRRTAIVRTATTLATRLASSHEQEPTAVSAG